MWPVPNLYLGCWVPDELSWWTAIWHELPQLLALGIKHVLCDFTVISLFCGWFPPNYHMPLFPLLILSCLFWLTQFSQTYNYILSPMSPPSEILTPKIAITLSVHGLYILFERCICLNFVKCPTIVSLKEKHLKYKETKWLKIKAWKTSSSWHHLIKIYKNWFLNIQEFWRSVVKTSVVWDWLWWMHSPCEWMQIHCKFANVTNWVLLIFREPVHWYLTDVSLT